MITRFNYFGVLLFLFTQSLVQAQNIQLVNSGEVIKQAILLYDSGRYDDAISLFTTVPKQDTNYVYMLSELALTLNAAEKY